MSSVVRLWFPLALYFPAVDNGPPLRVWSVPAVLLALYRRAVVMVCRCVCRPFLRFVRPLAFYRRAVFCWRSIALRLIMVRRGVCGPFLRFCWLSTAVRW